MGIGLVVQYWTRWLCVARRCWKKDWVIDFDVAQFFDSVPWDLMVKAVQANITTEQRCRR
jgi:hypothetical protein